MKVGARTLKQECIFKDIYGPILPIVFTSNSVDEIDTSAKITKQTLQLSVWREITNHLPHGPISPFLRRSVSVNILHISRSTDASPSPFCHALLLNTSSNGYRAGLQNVERPSIQAPQIFPPLVVKSYCFHYVTLFPVQVHEGLALQNICGDLNRAQGLCSRVDFTMRFFNFNMHLKSVKNLWISSFVLPNACHWLLLTR